MRLSTPQPRSHTIIEAHPDVYRFACDQGWDRRPGVRLVHGRWQDVIDQVGTQLRAGLRCACAPGVRVPEPGVG